jgi:hypothetical protein
MRRAISSTFASFVRDRRDIEISLIRQRDPLLAELLDRPVRISVADEFRLRAGVELAPGAGLERVLRRGWSFPEGWGVWSRGPKTTLCLAFDRATIFPVAAEFELEGFVRPGLSQSVAVSVSGRYITVMEFEPSQPTCVQGVEIVENDLSADFEAEIAFVIAKPTAPVELDPNSADRRKLGIAIRRLRIRRSVGEANSGPILEPLLSERADG